jgi:hypothetical protein
LFNANSFGAPETIVAFDGCINRKWLITKFTNVSKSTTIAEYRIARYAQVRWLIATFHRDEAFKAFS